MSCRLFRLPWGLAKILVGSLPDESGEGELGRNPSKGTVGATEVGTVGIEVGKGVISESSPILCSSSPRRSEGSNASARGLIGGFSISVRTGLVSSVGSGMVIPLLMLKKAGPDVKVGEFVPTWP